jgi:hypothetical protein
MRVILRVKDLHHHLWKSDARPQSRTIGCWPNATIQEVS